MLGVMLLGAGGCATRYRYATGQQAELLSLAGASSWFAWHAMAQPVARSTDPGVLYELVSGQTQAAVQAQCGQPIAVFKHERDEGVELWEYSFGLARFRRARLTGVEFNPHASGTSYYEQRWFVRWP